MNTKHLAFVASIISVMGCSDPAMDAREDVDSVDLGYAGMPPQPVAYWKFDTITQNGVPNEKGTWGSAAVLNGATLGSGAFDLGGAFDGIASRAEVQDNAALHFTNALTISLWVKPTNTTPPQTILGKWYGPDSYLVWLSNGYYRFAVALDNGAYANVALPATQGAYAHITAQFDGQTIRLEVTSSPTTQEASASAVGTLRQSNRPLTMGNHPSWNPFNGVIDDVKLYNTTNLDFSGIGMCFAPSDPTLGCSPPSNCCPPGDLP